MATRRGSRKLPNGKIAILTGTANPQLARDVAKFLGLTVNDALVSSFDDGETRIKVHDDVRGKHVFIIQPTCQPDRSMTEVVLLVRAIRSSVQEITLVIPYLGYARQDRKDQARVPISIVHIVRNLVSAGIDGVVLLEIHSKQIVGLFEMADAWLRVDHLFVEPVFLDRLDHEERRPLIVSSTDAGGASMARLHARGLKQLGFDVTWGVGDKIGSSSSGIERVELIGDFKGRDVIFIDDIGSTLNTLNEAARTAKIEKGAKCVIGMIAHPVFANDAACQRVVRGFVDQLFVTDSLALTPSQLLMLEPKLEVLTIAPLLAKAIRHLHLNQSISSLFSLEGYRRG